MAKGKDQERDSRAEDCAHAVVVELAHNGYTHLRLEVDSSALDAVRKGKMRTILLCLRWRCVAVTFMCAWGVLCL